MAYIGLFYKILVYKTPTQRSFGSPLSSDSTVLSSNTFEVTYVTVIPLVYCLNEYCLFAAFYKCF